MSLPYILEWSRRKHSKTSHGPYVVQYLQQFCNQKLLHDNSTCMEYPVFIQFIFRLFVMGTLGDLKKCGDQFFKDMKCQNPKHFASPEGNAVLNGPETVWLLRKILSSRKHCNTILMHLWEMLEVLQVHLHISVLMWIRVCF